MASKENLSVVIDIGTSKITGMAGRKTEDGKIMVVASALTDSRGVKRGIVFNIEEASASINRLLEQLGSQLDEEISQVVVALAGQLMKTIDYKTSRLTSEDAVVTNLHLDEMLNEAKNISTEEGYKILQVLPQSFMVDGEMAELSPLGITGREIEANYKIVLIPEMYRTNLQRVFDKTGVELDEIVLSPLALSNAVLTDEEKEMGVIVMDIGEGTTTLAVYHNNILIHTAVIPFAGGVITHDIKEGCSILYRWAEKLKVQYGQALGDKADDQKMVTIPGQNGWEPREISFKSLAFIIQARLVEILEIVNFHIEKSGIASKVGSGIVLTGGTSNLKNIVSLLQFETGMQVRKAHAILHLANMQKNYSGEEFLVTLGLLNTVLNNSDVPFKKKRKKRKSNDGGILPRIKGALQGALDFFDDENEDIAMN